jgi:hypothetical protein
MHACKNDCILYHGDAYIDLRECPVCKFPRFKVLKGGAADDMTDDIEDAMDTDQRSKKKRQKKG